MVHRSSAINIESKAAQEVDEKLDTQGRGFEGGRPANHNNNALKKEQAMMIMSASQ
jgi:hypothetical protein